MNGGSARKGYRTNAVAIPAKGKPLFPYDWYRRFLPYLLEHGWYTWFAKVVAFGETAAGIASSAGCR